MQSLVPALILGTVFGLTRPLDLGAQSVDPPSSPSSPLSMNVGPVPKGSSTVFGGRIRAIDPVRDQLTLGVYGGRPLKILFDERTEVYRDGQRMSLSSIRPEEEASVQTTLDGTKLFAVSIHTLSNAAEGECEGRVLAFDAQSGDLTVDCLVAGNKVQVLVEGDSVFSRKGQAAAASTQPGPADLVWGALVHLEFEPAGKDLPVARRVTILADPGSDFVFSGKLRALDVHSGSLVLIDPRDQRSYQLTFDPRMPAARNLHVGEMVRVVAKYDGQIYLATRIELR